MKGAAFDTVKGVNWSEFVAAPVRTWYGTYRDSAVEFAYIRVRAHLHRFYTLFAACALGLLLTIVGSTSSGTLGGSRGVLLAMGVLQLILFCFQFLVCTGHFLPIMCFLKVHLGRLRTSAPAENAPPSPKPPGPHAVPVQGTADGNSAVEVGAATVPRPGAPEEEKCDGCHIVERFHEMLTLLLPTFSIIGTAAYVAEVRHRCDDLPPDEMRSHGDVDACAVMVAPGGQFISILMASPRFPFACVLCVIYTIALTTANYVTNSGDVAGASIVLAIEVAHGIAALIFVRGTELLMRRTFETLAATHCGRQAVARHQRTIDAITATAVPPQALPRVRAARSIREAMHEDSVTDAAVGICDIADFAHWSTGLLPAHVVLVLHRLFTAFDDGASRFGVTKVATFADSYTVVAGLNKTAAVVSEFGAEGGGDAHARSVVAYAGWQLDDVGPWVQNSEAVAAPFQLRAAVALGSLYGGVAGKTHTLRYIIGGPAFEVARQLLCCATGGCISMDEDVEAAVNSYLATLEGDPGVMTPPQQSQPPPPEKSSTEQAAVIVPEPLPVLVSPVTDTAITDGSHPRQNSDAVRLLVGGKSEVDTDDAVSLLQGPPPRLRIDNNNNGGTATHDGTSGGERTVSIASVATAGRAPSTATVTTQPMPDTAAAVTSPVVVFDQTTGQYLLLSPQHAATATGVSFTSVQGQPSSSGGVATTNGGTERHQSDVAQHPPPAAVAVVNTSVVGGSSAAHPAPPPPSIGADTTAAAAVANAGDESHRKEQTDSAKKPPRNPLMKPGSTSTSAAASGTGAPASDGVSFASPTQFSTATGGPPMHTAASTKAPQSNATDSITGHHRRGAHHDRPHLLALDDVVDPSCHDPTAESTTTGRLRFAGSTAVAAASSRSSVRDPRLRSTTLGASSARARRLVASISGAAEMGTGAETSGHDGTAPMSGGAGNGAGGAAGASGHSAALDSSEQESMKSTALSLITLRFVDPVLEAAAQVEAVHDDAALVPTTSTLIIVSFLVAALSVIVEAIIDRVELDLLHIVALCGLALGSAVHAVRIGLIIARSRRPVVVRSAVASVAAVAAGGARAAPPITGFDETTDTPRGSQRTKPRSAASVAGQMAQGRTARSALANDGDDGILSNTEDSDASRTHHNTALQPPPTSVPDIGLVSVGPSSQAASIPMTVMPGRPTSRQVSANDQSLNLGGVQASRSFISATGDQTTTIGLDDRGDSHDPPSTAKVAGTTERVANALSSVKKAAASLLPFSVLDNVLCLVGLGLGIAGCLRLGDTVAYRSRFYLYLLLLATPQLYSQTPSWILTAVLAFLFHSAFGAGMVLLRHNDVTDRTPAAIGLAFASAVLHYITRFLTRERFQTIHATQTLATIAASKAALQERLVWALLPAHAARATLAELHSAAVAAVSAQSPGNSSSSAPPLLAAPGYAPRVPTQLDFWPTLIVLCGKLHPPTPTRGGKPAPAKKSADGREPSFASSFADCAKLWGIVSDAARRTPQRPNHRAARHDPDLPPGFLWADELETVADTMASSSLSRSSHLRKRPPRSRPGHPDTGSNRVHSSRGRPADALDIDDDGDGDDDDFLAADAVRARGLGADPEGAVDEVQRLQLVDFFGDEFTVAGPFAALNGDAVEAAVHEAAQDAIGFVHAVTRSVTADAGSVTVVLTAGAAYSALLGGQLLSYRLLGPAVREADAMLAAAPAITASYAAPAFRRVHQGNQTAATAQAAGTQGIVPAAFLEQAAAGGARLSSDFSFPRFDAESHRGPTVASFLGPPSVRSTVRTGTVAASIGGRPVYGGASSALLGSQQGIPRLPIERDVSAEGDATFLPPQRWRMRGAGVLMVSALRPEDGNNASSRF